MQTGSIIGNILIGGVGFATNVSRTAEGSVGQSLTLPAGVAGAISASGVDGLVTGHGFVGTNVICVHWLDPSTGARKSRRGLTVDSASANAIVFDNTPAGEGDALPATATAVVVSLQITVQYVTFVGADAVIMAARMGNNGVMDLRTSGASVLVVEMNAGEGWSWVDGQGVANPVTGSTIAVIYASNAGLTASDFLFGALVDTVA